MTRYAIFNTIPVNGYLQGHMKDINFLYYEGASIPSDPMGQQTWTLLLDEAKLFDSEEDAWAATFDIWGINFASENMGVLCVHEKALESAQLKANIIRAHKGIR